MRLVLRKSLLFVAVAAIVAVSAAAAVPSALRGVAAGRWDLSRSATGENPVRLCVSEIASLAQFEHRGQACTRVVLSDKPGEVVIHYTCPAGDFGRTKMTVLTPRSLRLNTQGIRGGEPFDYTLHARRAGNC